LDLLAGVTIGIFIIIGLFHIYWALGAELFLDRVLPNKEGKRVFNPGSFACLIVALLLFGFAFVVYILYFAPFHSKLFTLLGWGISFVFLLRAIGEFHLLGFFKKVKKSIFAQYDTWLFSPLCLFLSLSSAIITYHA